MDQKQIQETAYKVYQYMVKDHQECSEEKNEVDVNPASWGLNINHWEWNAGVGITGISDYYSACNNQEVLNYLNGWIQRNKNQIKKVNHTNSMAPFTIYPDMFGRTGDDYYLKTAIDHADWFLENASRTVSGVLKHGGGTQSEVWADTVFMVVVFLARLSRLTGSSVYAGEAAKQLLWHLKLLQDEESGVLFHGYHYEEKHHKSAVRWARGNSWLAVTTPMILKEIQEITEIPAELTQRYQRMIDGLLRYQAENGLWHTVVDRPDFYHETSASAGIACGIFKAVQQGLLSPSYVKAAELALKGVLEKITPQGEVTSVSGGTPIMKSAEEYGKLSCYPTLYGQGLTLMLLSQCITEK